MTTESILKKVRKIEIKSKGLSNHIFSGEYHTAFKGRGMSFSEVREYMPGDDVRSMDWNVTARLRTPYIKVYEEERELTVMLLIDISSSSQFGGLHQSKREIMAELAAVIAFSAAANNDKVGVIFFSDKVEKYLPPKKGRSHILRIIREAITLKPGNHHFTNIDECLRQFNLAIKRKTIAFLISDFVSAGLEQSLKITARKHDLIGLQVYDKLEHELPRVGGLYVMDSEQGKAIWLDTENAAVRKKYAYSFEENTRQVKSIFQKHNAQFLSLDVAEDYVRVLHQFFKSRG